MARMCVTLLHMREIRTEITLPYSCSRVWALLTKFSHYEHWNPFIIEGCGRAEVGAIPSFTISPPGGKAMRFKPTLLVVESERELRWRGKLLLPGLFDGEHIFELHSTPNGGCHLTHREQFSGLLVPLIWGMVEKPTRAGFELMNLAIGEELARS